MNKLQPKISIITASYNYEGFISETIESVINQTYTNWELIVVDDGSTDNSIEIIQTYCNKDKRIKLYTHENNQNKGLTETIKLGLSKVSGNWIAFLESDDIFTQNALEEKVKIIHKEPKCSFIFSDVEMFGENKIINDSNKYFYKNMKKKFTKSGFYELSADFVYTNWICTFSCVMCRKELFNELDFYPVINQYLDYWLWAQIAQTTKMYYLNQKLTKWRMHSKSYINSVADSQSEMFDKSIRKICRKDLHSLLCFFKFCRRKIFTFKTGTNAHIKILNIPLFNIDNIDSHKIITILGIKFKRRIMKLGVSYNLFDGEELLEASIMQIRKQVDYINVIYQKKSYYKKEASANIEELLQKLVQKHIIDEIYLYDKDFDNSDKILYEKEKRDIGLKLAKMAGCTHFLNMDVDEFYDTNDFINAKEYIIQNDIDSSAVPIYEYLKNPKYRFVNSYTFTDGYDDYSFYVPFILRIKKKCNYTKSKYFSCLVDPSRRYCNNGRFYLFSIQDIVMHHMSTIRKDINKKYESSNLRNGGQENIKKIEKIQKDLENWNFDDNRLGSSEYALFQNKLIKKVKNKFNINIGDKK